MSVIMFVAGVAVGAVAMYLGTRRRAPSEKQLIEFADQLDAVERDVWKQAGVGLGYSIDYGTGATDVSIRVPGTGEDIVLRVERPGLERRKRSIGDTLGITKELPPSLGGHTIGGDA